MLGFIITMIICCLIFSDYVELFIGIMILVLLLWAFSHFTLILKFFGLIALVFCAVFVLKKIKKRYLKNALTKIAEETVHAFKTAPSYNKNMYTKDLDSEVIEEDQQPKERYLKLEDKVVFYQRSLEKIMRMDTNHLIYNWGLLPYFSRQKEELIDDVISNEMNTHFNLKPYMIRSFQNEINDFEEYKNEIMEEYNKEYLINNNGVSGEKRVNEEISMYSDEFINLENIRLVVDGESVETDNIVISEYGIFSIEVKNFSESGSYSLRITKDGQWLKVLKNGEIKAMKDVWSQVNRHLFYKQRFLEQQIPKEMGISKDSLSIHPIVVIANDQILIDNQSDLPVLRASQIHRYMTNRKGQRLKPEEIRFLKELFEKHTKESKSYPVLDYVPILEDWYESIKDKVEYINSYAPVTMNYYEEIKKNKLVWTMLNFKEAK